MRRFLAALALLATTAHAGELAGPPAPKGYRAVPVEDLADRFAGHAALIGFSFAADMGTTSWALRRCPTCYERGLGADVEARVALHLAAATATVGGVYVLERTGHKNWARAVAIVTGGIFLGAAVNNSVHAIRRR